MIEITDSNTRIIATITAPPEVVEIDITDINNPFFYKIFSIRSDK